MLGLFINAAAVGQNWTTGSLSFHPTGGTTAVSQFNSSVRVGIGVTSAAEMASILNVKGNIKLYGASSSISSNTGFGLTIKNGDANTTTASPLRLVGARNGGAGTPGSVKIESGDFFNNSATLSPSSAPLEVGWNTIRIGTGSSLTALRTGGYLLGVSGKVIVEELVAKLSGSWPDFVFAKNFQLRSLAELETYIKTNQHLPGIPSECELKET